MLNVDSFSLNDCHLKPNRIDIWYYSLLSGNQDAQNTLSSEEQERANRFYFDHHQRRFTNAHHLLRLILSNYVNTPADQLEFIKNAYGKPSLVNHPHLQFNLSHSGDFALLAVGQTYPLGIDLEHFSARPYQGIGQSLFSKRENELLDQVPTSLLPLSFFNIWVQKEALIKACGLGLSYPTKQFDVSLLSSNSQIIEDTLHQCTWQMLSFMPKVGCCAAICYDMNVNEIRYLSLTEDQVDQL